MAWYLHLGFFVYCSICVSSLLAEDKVPGMVDAGSVKPGTFFNVVFLRSRAMVGDLTIVVSRSSFRNVSMIGDSSKASMTVRNGIAELDCQAVFATETVPHSSLGAVYTSNLWRVRGSACDTV